MRAPAWIAAALLCAVTAPPTMAAPPPTIPTLQFDKTVLPNGLQLILHVDKKLPLVHVNLWYHVGAKNERPGKTGFAHLFEHLMLQGSKHAPEDFFTLMARAGAKGGRDSNGTTDLDRTNYFSTAPSGSLEFLLWVHADLLATLLDGLTQAKLDNQREVVRNERRENRENVPYGRWWEIVAGAVFPEGHPYGRDVDVLGSDEDLRSASLEDVKSFFRTYYTPSNLTLVISGDFEPAHAKELVQEYFGSIAPGPMLVRPERDLPRLDGEKRLTVTDRVPQDRLFFAWPTPQIGGAGQHELTLAASILARGLGARLQKKLIHEEKLCSTVEAWEDAMETAGLFVVDATVRPGASSAAVERIISDEIARLGHEGPTAAELDRARTGVLTERTIAMQDIGAFGGASDLLATYNVFFGDPALMSADLKRLVAVTPQSLRAAVARWLGPNRAIVRFTPDTSVRPSLAEPDRARRPALGADTPFVAPKVETATLANGLSLYVVERHDLPLVTAAVLSRAGSIYDPPGKEGLAALVAGAMERGTATRNSLAIADALANLGTALRTVVRLEFVAQTLTVQKLNVAPALLLLGDVVRNASYPASEVESTRQRQLDRMAQEERDPWEIGRRLRGRFLFGADHPYGRPIHGYRRTVSKLTAADALAFHRANWKPAGVALVLVGDLTLPEATALAERALGGWQGGMPALPAIPPPTPAARGKIVIADRPDSTQTTVVQLLSAPRERGEDFFAWQLASDVFGGNLAGRLYANLRQDKGYSYGVSSFTWTLSRGLAWIAEGPVQADKTRESVIEFVKELKGIAGTRPISTKELEDARLADIRNYAAGFATNDDIAWRVADLWSLRWPMEELQRTPEELAKATLTDVQAAARRYAVPSESGIILIGDRHKIESGVRALKLGEVIVVDGDGNELGPLQSR
jgi:zinc protease